MKEAIFENVFIQPSSGDAGGSLGAAQAAYHIYFDQERDQGILKPDAMQGAYLGPSYTSREIDLMARKYNAAAVEYMKILVSWLPKLPNISKKGWQ